MLYTCSIVPFLTLFCMAVLGAISASFAGVIAARLNTGESWARGRSRCDSCGMTLALGDLVPIFSWFFSHGRCRGCRAKISVWYPIVEFTLGGLFVLSSLRFGYTFALALFLAALFVLTVIVLYDFRHTVVPSVLSTAFVLLGLLFAYHVAPDASVFGIVLMESGIFGFVFLALHVCSGGRAMGLGDAPMVFGLSLLAGPQAFSGLLFSFWIGAILGILILVSRPRGRRMYVEVPFVPYLAAGFLLAIFTEWNPLTWFIW